MKILVKKVTENPYFVLTGWLATIIALVIAIIVPIVQTKKVRLNFTYNTNPLVTDSLSEVEGLNIDFKGKKIDQLSVTACKLVNDGNVTIEDSDVYEGHKIRIYPTSDDIDIYFASIISQTYDTVNSQIIYDDKSLTWCFDTLERNDEVIINIYHSGREDVNFLIDGKIKEGKIYLSEKNRSRYVSILISVLISGLLGMIAGFLLDPLCSFFKFVNRFSVIVVSTIFVIIIGFLSAILMKIMIG